MKRAKRIRRDQTVIPFVCLVASAWSVRQAWCDEDQGGNVASATSFQVFPVDIGFFILPWTAMRYAMARNADAWGGCGSAMTNGFPGRRPHACPDQCFTMLGGITSRSLF
jgi:hypothetical protein